MEHVLCSLYKDIINDSNTLGVLSIEGTEDDKIFKGALDVLLIIIVKKSKREKSVKYYYELKNKKTGIFTFTERCIKKWLFTKQSYVLMDFILKGEVLYEQDEFIKDVKTRLLEYPLQDRLKEIGIEFAKFINEFSAGRTLFNEKQYLDSFHHIVKALHHLARMTLIEQGVHPKLTVWEQVKEIKPEVYKLYSELVLSHEPIEKRIELLLLMNTVSLSLNAEVGGRHLLSVMQTKDTFWTYTELLNHKDLQRYGVSLILLIEHLINKGHIEMKKIDSNYPDLYFYMYSIKKKKKKQVYG